MCFCPVVICSEDRLHDDVVLGVVAAVEPVEAVPAKAEAAAPSGRDLREDALHDLVVALAQPQPRLLKV